ncbi:MAG: glycosyltransferase family 2 protein [Eggerthellaceae bacterium]|nr:glycosyltransferase family 2 protein [Eggerthellaceae bacterium]
MWAKVYIIATNAKDKDGACFMRTLLIIPAYNEEESLEATIRSIELTSGDADFLIVNDGSKDGTAEVCRRNGYPFLDLPVNLGLAGAFQAGMKYAYRHGYDCAIQFDADGQHLPEYISTLEKAIMHADIVIGSRFVNEKKPKSMRMLGSNLIQGAIKLTTGKTIKDPTSGMRAFNSRMIELMARGLNCGPEPDTVSYLIKRANAEVVEVPVKMAERFAGESYLNVWTSAKYMLRMSISILFMQFVRKRIGGEAK